AQDAPVLARLDAAGAVFLGRTNMTELAYSGVGINPHFGTPPCAFDEARVPGGSSSGSGVAVALRLAAAAVGSDTGGSVRIPAAVNGIVGLKTTDGALPTEGTVPLSLTLDTIGPMARSSEDAWTLLNAMLLRNHRVLSELGGPLTVLAPTTLLTEDLEPEVAEAFRHALEILVSLGHEVRSQELPMLAEAPALYRDFGSFASYEAWALYEQELSERKAEFDPRVTSRIEEHAERPAKDYIRLHLRRNELRQKFWAELAGVDVIVAPTLPILPPRIDDLREDAAYFRANGMLLRNTAPFNVLGSPAVSVPVPGWRSAGGLSVGLMIVARPGEEELTLSLAREVERFA
ncbi:MAG TPA: amidase family protein, partial [Trueperaceae bacterium]|nr:amidase family protein [Trueperaceae bacterium]